MIVNLIGLALLAFVLYWFWPRAPKGAGSTQLDLIRVEDGVYEPDAPTARAGRALTLRFLRLDASPCAQVVVFPDLAISAELALGRETRVELPALAPGRYPFHCQMQMYRGELLVH
ncbi:cupredoxin domain-containing protein [Gallaecimonas sp. GXIMD4217]|uniref:cupredoxin domain-containing protein n=1 Tax=Gallaecimonas sp. GXIMD4217 TaxID=3131927 RepID=UPI00311B349B